jgi:hypothetical protein
MAAKRVNIGVRLMPHTIAAMDAAAERLGKSRAFVIEVMTALIADSLTRETSVPLGMVPADSRTRPDPTAKTGGKGAGKPKGGKKS